MIHLKKNKGFTLIELLVSVAIFSGVIILALGAFARSADSSIKSSAIRDRTEAARTIVDRIGNDIQYIYTGSNNDKEFYASPKECGDSSSPLALGLYFRDTPQSKTDCLALLLQYPGKSDSELVLRVYKDFDSTSVGLVEFSGCSIAPDPDKTLSCEGDTGQQQSNLISDRFVVVDQSIFSGINPLTARDSQTTPILRIEVTVKPVNSGVCSDSPPSPCYTIKSSFVPGA